MIGASKWAFMSPAFEWPKLNYEALIGDIADVKSMQYETTTYSWTVKAGAPWVTYMLSDWIVEPEPLDCDPPPDLEVEFGPQNWLSPTEPVHAPLQFAQQVSSRLPQFRAVETHAPKSPGFDFSKYDDEPYYLEKKSKKGRK